MKINFQRLRHLSMARLVRAILYRTLVGAESWPLVFQGKNIGDEWKDKSSPNIYVHLPFCQSICPHCPYNKTLFQKSLFDSYRKRLLDELNCHFQTSNRERIQTLYFGGGTPSLSPSLIAEIIQILSPYFETSVDIGVEIHPHHATHLLLGEMKTAGVNRISLAIETFDDSMLEFMNRRYDSALARSAVKIARSMNFDCFDINLIYGFPGQKWRSSVQDALYSIRSGADQISAYPLFTFMHTPLGSLLEKKYVPISDEIARLRSQKRIAQECLRSGLKRTSVWSYTRPGVSPYSTVTHDTYVGFGAGAGSKVGGSLWFNTFSVEEYVEQKRFFPALRLDLSERVHRFHWIYWQLYKCHLDPKEYEKLFSRVFVRDYRFMITAMKLLGWLRSDSSTFFLTESGVLWGHRLQSLFSLTFIDELWKACQADPWPSEVVLS